MVSQFTTTWLFVQQLIQAERKKSSKICVTGPLWGESIGDQSIPLTKGQLCKITLPGHDTIIIYLKETFCDERSLKNKNILGKKTKAIRM